MYRVLSVLKSLSPSSLLIRRLSVLKFVAAVFLVASILTSMSVKLSISVQAQVIAGADGQCNPGVSPQITNLGDVGSLPAGAVLYLRR